jgi:G3E family GTPase
VLIETTGIANPLPLAQAFYTDMSLSLTYRLDAIVTLVDLRHVEGQLHNVPEAERQISLADKIIFNKRDLVDDEQYHAAATLVRALNPLALTTTVSYSTSVYSIRAPERRQSQAGSASRMSTRMARASNRVICAWSRNIITFTIMPTIMRMFRQLVFASEKRSITRSFLRS